MAMRTCFALVRTDALPRSQACGLQSRKESMTREKREAGDGGVAGSWTTADLGTPPASLSNLLLFGRTDEGHRVSPSRLEMSSTGKQVRSCRACRRRQGSRLETALAVGGNRAVSFCSRPYVPCGVDVRYL